MTYQEAWQRITTAYVNGQLDPYIECACFVGNLLGGSGWGWCRMLNEHHSRVLDVNRMPNREFRLNVLQAYEYVAERGDNMYSPADIAYLEDTFLSTITKTADKDVSLRIMTVHKDDIRYEDALYEAMVVTLEELRKIHIAKGENVDQIFLSQRKLATA